jgi:four helix bundle protein
MKSFEELRVFKCAIELTLAIYQVSERFPKAERFGLTAQIRRAATSVMSHIAEGQGRLTLGEWRQFLSQARGSLYEVQSHAIAALHLGFMDAARFKVVGETVRNVAAPLNGLIGYVRKREAAAKRKAT